MQCYFRGWIHRWKKRHGIRYVRVCGESKSADVAGAEEFLPMVQKLIDEEGYSKDQMFNTDETALYWKGIPDGTLAHRADSDAKKGWKDCKDRVTLLLCSNWSGSLKVKPLVIGKFMKPRCFHHVNMATLSVEYTATKNAWMKGAVFDEWFKKSFVPAVRRHLRSRRLEDKKGAPEARSVTGG
jgi:hypothetical protein